MQVIQCSRSRFWGALFKTPGLFAAAVALGIAVSPIHAQLEYTGGLVRQDFNGLPAAGPFDFSDVGIGKGPALLANQPVVALNLDGWSIYAQTGTQLLLGVDDGTLATPSAYSYGLHASTDRALGSLAGSNHRAYFGWKIANRSEQTLTQFTLSLYGEQWRNGGTSSFGGFEAEYRVASTGDIDTGTYTAIDLLDVTALSASTAGSFAMNGNDSANRMERSATVTGLNWQPNQLLILRWRDIDETGADNGLAVDDVLFYAPTAPVVPTVVSVTPAGGAANVPLTAPIVVTFNQPVGVAGPWFELSGSVSGPIAAAINNAGPMRYKLIPSAPLASGETVTVRILGSAVTSAASQTMGADFVSTFRTLPTAATVTAIDQVQGSDGYSPLVGAVVTVEGVVVADFQGAFPALGGIYLQEEDAQSDADAATSEGIWIGDSGSAVGLDVGVGDIVRVTGTVSEANAVTQLTSLSAMTKVGATGLPSAGVVALPTATTISLERFEGMLVEVPQALSVTSASSTTTITDNFARFGELLLAADGPFETPTEFIDPNDSPASGTTATGKANAPLVHAQERAQVLRSLILDDASRANFPDPTPFLNSLGTRRCGDTVTGLRGILTYSNGAYRMQPVRPVSFVDANPRPATPPNVAGRIKVAAMNVLNYFVTFGGANDRGASNPTEFQRQKEKVIAALTALDADVLGLIEIQNTSQAVNDIVGALNGAVAGNPYTVVPDPVGAASADVIRSVLLYRQSKVDLHGSCYADAASVWDRYPLAQVFVERSTGERFITCLNHWKSKSSSGASGLNVDQNDGQAAYNDQRRQQATRLLAWLATVCTAVGDNDVLIIGDLNSYGEEDPLDILRASGYADQSARFHPDDYSYRIGSQRGRLDHAFGTTTMAAQIQAAAHWHINADEPAFYDYNIENKSAGQMVLNVGTPFRSSDHDPMIIGVSLSPQPTTYAMWAASRQWPSGANTAPDGDDDGDGMKNLLEFVQNAAPELSDAMLQPLPAMNGTDCEIHFRQRTNAIGVTIRPQWSDDLSQWHDLTTIMFVQPIDALTELRKAIVPAVNRIFMRVQVETSD